MNLIADSDVQEVAEFMQTRIPANRLVSVANGLAAIAPTLWGCYTPAEEIRVLQLVVTLGCDLPKLPSARESAPE